MHRHDCSKSIFVGQSPGQGVRKLPRLPECPAATTRPGFLAGEAGGSQAVPVLPCVRTRLWAESARGFRKLWIIQANRNFGQIMKPDSGTAAAARRIIGRALGWLLLWRAGVVLALWLQSAVAVVALVVAGGWILFSAFTLYFFRDPEPRVPTASDAVVAPGHGLVDCVEETNEPEFMRGPCRRVSIFLSVFDVHVQNAPVAGTIAFLKYQPGQFLSALKADSARYNENILIGIESSERPDERIAVRQIAGLIARRVVSWVNVGDHVARGQRLGLIQYGSRCDLYLPLSAEIVIRCGDRVIAGETVVARRNIVPSERNEGVIF